jgi:hypothetical protein
MTDYAILKELKRGYFKKYFFMKNGTELPLYLRHSTENIVNASVSEGRHYRDTGEITLHPFFNSATIAQRRFILAHEMAHVARKDYYRAPIIHCFLWIPGFLLILAGVLSTGALLAVLGGIGYFFYPSWLSRKIEKKADRMAVAACEPGDRYDVLLFAGKHLQNPRSLMSSHPDGATRMAYIDRFFRKIHGTG